ncbi:putative AT-rich interactive domain-containing protein 5A [Scophthalmus maximus]|uniref:Putative AT-rich interactive domain-containing protein 5A n=1 Tax=Scophthalmus maximus TaxID=52904 RepID=A0A2U9BRN6_SCOMX|nr:putative AT-rich interactive domain-containing protein 5A [Scophthalmus maximus]
MSEAQDGQGERSRLTEASDEEEVTMKQASPPVIEIHDSMTECEEEPGPGPVPMEEKAFVSSLHAFMKGKGSPIERIPHLGFKQINLWRIYKAVEKRGGYDVVTAQRLWKKVYDELGGSPGSTSAATCTRRHYERLVLPFERHIKGEEDKPLPPGKPRKPYKRNLDCKVKKAEVKRKRTPVDREMDSEESRGCLPKRSGDASSPCSLGRCVGQTISRLLSANQSLHRSLHFRLCSSPGPHIEPLDCSHPICCCRRGHLSFGEKKANGSGQPELGPYSTERG